jgi:alpha-L-rhamnosidase
MKPSLLSALLVAVILQAGAAALPAVPPAPGADRAFLAKWIWLPAEANFNERNAYAYFRKTFRAGGRLTIDIAADTWYELYLDGRRVDRGTMPAVPAFKAYDTHVVEVAEGLHAAAVLVHHFGEVSATAMRSRPGLFVEIRPESGEPVLSDGTWKALPAPDFFQALPVMMSHFGFYEVRDFERTPNGWTAPPFDDGGWFAAAEIGTAGVSPWLRLEPRAVPKLATIAIQAAGIVQAGTYSPGAIPESVREATPAVEMACRIRRAAGGVPPAFPVTLGGGEEGGCVAIDFGREVTGHVRLSFSGAKAGQKIDVGYDESLSPAGWPDPRPTYVHFADRYFLAEGQTAVEVYGGRGFRYLLVDVAAGRGGLRLDGAAVEERTYPVMRRATFRASDPRLERIFETALETLRLCMLDTYVDCPGRERVMWMDLQSVAPTALYGFGVADLWRTSLVLLARNPSAFKGLEGAIKGFAPTDNEPLLVSYLMGFVISVSEYVFLSGDRETAEALWPVISKQFEILRAYLTPDGLVNEKFPGWGTFLDWSAMDFGGVSAGNNALYILMHRRAGALAGFLGREGEAKRLEAEADRLAGAFRARFWLPKEGLFADALYDGRPSAVRSQYTQAAAVAAGVVRGREAKKLLTRIIDPSRLLPRTPGDFRLRPGFQPQTGGLVPVGTPASGALLADALFEAGMEKEALEFVLENWPPIGRNGVFGEHFIEDGNTSFCHAWAAGPVLMFLTRILGVRPLRPGWEEIAIDPRPSGLAFAEGRIPTPKGDLSISWKTGPRGLEIKTDAPPGLRIRPAKGRSGDATPGESAR